MELYKKINASPELYQHRDGNPLAKVGDKDYLGRDITSTVSYLHDNRSTMSVWVNFKGGAYLMTFNQNGKFSDDGVTTSHRDIIEKPIK